VRSVQVFEEDYDGPLHCVNCGASLYIRTKGNIVQEVRLAIYSHALPSSIPQEVSNDYDEAIRCFNSKAYKATVVMCRRSLEITADLKQANGSNLAQKLEDLKKNGLLDDATYSTASGIRLFGNYGAHPKDDLLKTVREFEAELVIKITGRVLSEIWQ
jgi:hypothetical protein